jgi:hypothetical protein
MKVTQFTLKQYQHFCNDWDGLEIDSEWVEFMCCNCYEYSPEIRQIQDELRKTYEAEISQVCGQIREALDGPK